MWWWILGAIIALTPMTCVLKLEYYESRPVDEKPSRTFLLESESWMYIHETPIYFKVYIFLSVIGAFII